MVYKCETDKSGIVYRLPYHVCDMGYGTSIAYELFRFICDIWIVYLGMGRGIWVY